MDPFCCDNQWDQQCVNEASQLCAECGGGGTGGGGTGGGGTGGGGGGSSCAHDECTAGAKLTTGCSSCASSVCAQDPYCCNTEWDSVCVSYVEDYCSFSCN
jgi:hypothetical protein